MAGLIDNLKEKLLDEKDARHFFNARAESVAQKQILKVLQAIHKTKNINAIMDAERAINMHELLYYSNSKQMESSLKQTLTSLDITINLIHKFVSIRIFQRNRGQKCPKKRIILEVFEHFEGIFNRLVHRKNLLQQTYSCY